MASTKIKHYVLTLTGAAQKLSDVYTDKTAGGAEDLPMREIHLQLDPAATHVCNVGGDNTVSATVYGFQIPLPPGGIPGVPFKLGPYPSGPIRPSDIWVFGTNTEKLHIFGICF